MVIVDITGSIALVIMTALEHTNLESVFWVRACLTPEKMQGVLFMPSGRLTSCLETMLQSPGTVFTYWELSPSLTSLLKPGDRLLLRLYRVDGAGGCLLAEQELTPGTADWYFHNLAPAAVYYCEIGVREGDLYLALLRSEPVATPPTPVAYVEWLAGLFAGQSLRLSAGAFVGEKRYLSRPAHPAVPSWSTADALGGMYFYTGILAG